MKKSTICFIFCTKGFMGVPREQGTLPSPMQSLCDRCLLSMMIKALSHWGQPDTALAGKAASSATLFGLCIDGLHRYLETSLLQLVPKLSQTSCGCQTLTNCPGCSLCDCATGDQQATHKGHAVPAPAEKPSPAMAVRLTRLPPSSAWASISQGP